MASFYVKFARRTTWPAIAAVASQQTIRFTRCDDSSNKTTPQLQREVEPILPDEKAIKEKEGRVKTAGMRPDETGDFHGLFPKRQLFQPRLEYPLWDNHWDDHRQSSTSIDSNLNDEERRQHQRQLRKNGVTRHIILIRHGQYEEKHREDEKRILTELGRTQAELTGQRLAEMLRGVNETFGPCRVRVLRVSDLARAKETADIIARYLPGVECTDPDPLLNEGRPAHYIPCEKASQSVIEKTDEGHQRIEEAFKKYFYRSEQVVQSTEEEVKEQDKHEFEIIVCHGNVIRYFLCRALQIPPEAWLRLCTFNCSLTYMTIRPTGTVSCRMLGDIGHLPYDKTSFSGHHGFNW